MQGFTSDREGYPWFWFPRILRKSSESE